MQGMGGAGGVTGDPRHLAGVPEGLQVPHWSALRADAGA